MYHWVLLSYRYLSPPIVHASTSTSDTHAGAKADEQDLTSSSIARLSDISQALAIIHTFHHKQGHPSQHNTITCHLPINHRTYSTHTS
jgi:hypothetical protein